MSVNDILDNGPLMAIIGGAITTSLIKGFDYFTKNKEVSLSESTKLRVDLWEQLGSLKLELSQKELDLDMWKDKYYVLLEKYNDAVRRERQALNDLDDLKKELDKVKPPTI